MEKVYKRICENCGKELVYSSQSSYWLANKNNSLCRSCGSKKAVKRTCNLGILLEDSFETFYWIGFILADGSISNNRLSIMLGIKDKEHLIRFAKYIQYSEELKETDINISFSSKNIDIIGELCAKFDIKQNKTCYPPNSINSFSEDLKYCLLAGFIDGDGNITNQTNRKDFSLRIKLHASWLFILEEFNMLICNNTKFAKINNQGYAQLVITDSEILKNLKRRIESYNIPILNRKWDIINYNFISKNIASNVLKENVLNDLRLGISGVEIARKYNTSKSNVTRIKNKYYE